MRSIVIFRFFSHLPLLFVYQCITFLPLIFRFSLYICTMSLCNIIPDLDLMSAEITRIIRQIITKLCLRIMRMVLKAVSL